MMLSPSLRQPSVILAGAGPSGIAMAYNLKHVSGLDSECDVYHMK